MITSSIFSCGFSEFSAPTGAHNTISKRRCSRRRRAEDPGIGRAVVSLMSWPVRSSPPSENESLLLPLPRAAHRSTLRVAAEGRRGESAEREWRPRARVLRLPKNEFYPVPAHRKGLPLTEPSTATLATCAPAAHNACGVCPVGHCRFPRAGRGGWAAAPCSRRTRALRSSGAPGPLSRPSSQSAPANKVPCRRRQAIRGDEMSRSVAWDGSLRRRCLGVGGCAHPQRCHHEARLPGPVAVRGGGVLRTTRRRREVGCQVSHSVRRHARPRSRCARKAPHLVLPADDHQAAACQRIRHGVPERPEALRGDSNIRRRVSRATNRL